MKALFLLLSVATMFLFKAFIEWEERSYYLRISSIPVNKNLKRKEILLFALKSAQQQKQRTAYPKRKKRLS